MTKEETFLRNMRNSNEASNEIIGTFLPKVIQALLTSL